MELLHRLTVVDFDGHLLVLDALIPQGVGFRVVDLLQDVAESHLSAVGQMQQPTRQFKGKVVVSVNLTGTVLQNI
jgi:hypothetical protein